MAPPRGAVLAQARVTVQVLPAVRVRQGSGPEPAAGTAPAPQLTRRGRTILVEFE